MELVLLLPALVGHGFLWAAFFNHTHCTALPRWIVGPSTIAGLACTLLLPVAYAAWLVRGPFAFTAGAGWASAIWMGRFYLGACWVAGLVATIRWVRRLARRPPDVLQYERTRPCGSGWGARGGWGRAKLAPSEPCWGQPAADRQPPPASPSPTSDPPGPWRVHHWLGCFPSNQILKLQLVERGLTIPRLAPALDRLSIVHLSDLHFSGQVSKSYFEEVVRIANGLDPDLVAVTGDLVDRSRFIDWVPDTLGKLTSRYGAYFVLGNHDTWFDTPRLRQTLVDCGLVDLGSRWMETRVRGEPVVLAGNELPWIAPAADLKHAPPGSSDGGPLRIVLAHCPDQLAWARRNGVDLLLAGHTHGGQFRLPVVGPFLSASRLGAAYSSGTFHVPPTIMHVSRGVSARFPLRLGCPPEIVKLVLRTARS
jgi:predicted MPP superfamily phosphohydrolase